MLKRLPPIPIVFDFRFVGDTIKKQNRMISALRYRNRIVAVNFVGSDVALETFLKAMRHPFPVLESLALECLGKWNYDLPNTFLQGSAQRLRRLKLAGVTLSSLSQLLSSTTGLVGLDLKSDANFCPSPVALLPTLQGMPSLRCLALAEPDDAPSYIRPIPIIEKEDIISLSNLTCFHFSGYRTHLEGLMARLAASSLQEVHIQLYDHPPTPPILHLPRFIRDVGRPAFSAEFKFVGSWPRVFVLQSMGEPPLRLIVFQNVFSVLRTLSDMIATVEDLLFTHPSQTKRQRSLARRSFQWRMLIGKFRNVKILRLRHALVLDVAKFFLRKGEKRALDLLPMLERIELHPGGHDKLFSERQRASVLNSFRPFVAARERIGRPVYVFWNTDQVLPIISCDATDRRLCLLDQ
jgi:hypothetical protein